MSGHKKKSQLVPLRHGLAFLSCIPGACAEGHSLYPLDSTTGCMCITQL
nr:MAG TPA: hypothetical protein [Caudoviricetes sp.]